MLTGSEACWLYSDGDIESVLVLSDCQVILS